MAAMSSCDETELADLSLVEGRVNEAGSYPTGEKYSLRTTVYHLRLVLSLVAIGTVAGTLPGPSIQFTKLSFFAENRGGGDCNATPTSDPCRQASSAVTVYHGISGAIAHSCAWMFALLLGSYSDRVGRRPLLIAAGLLSLLSRLALVAHLLLGITLWVFLLFEPILTVFDVHGVFLAVMNDVVIDSRQRVLAYSVLMGVALSAGGLGVTIGSTLAAPVAALASTSFGVLKLAFLTRFFTETAPRVTCNDMSPDIGKQKLSPAAIIRESFRVIVATPRNFRMTMVLVFSGLSTTGWMNVWTPYLVAYMGFNQQRNGHLMLACGISITISFLCCLRPLLAKFGNYGAMRFCLTLKILFYFLCALSWMRIQILVVHAFLLGPIVLLYPIMATIQSNLVGEESQGQMQGILAACKTIATAIGEIVFSWLYKYTTDSGKRPDRSAAVPALLIATGLAVFGRLLASAGDLTDEKDSDPDTETGTDTALGSHKVFGKPLGERSKRTLDNI